jgi:hypothetical protein
VYNNLSILFENFSWCENCTADKLGSSAADCIDGRLWEVNGRVRGYSFANGVLQGFICCEKCTRRRYRDEDDGSDALVQSPEERTAGLAAAIFVEFLVVW